MSPSTERDNHMFIGFIISLFLAVLFGLKLVAFMAHHIAVAGVVDEHGSARFQSPGKEINTGIVVTTIAITSAVTFYHFM